MKAKRTKALEIPKEVKEAVAKRDKFKGWTCCGKIKNQGFIGNETKRMRG